MLPRGVAYMAIGAPTAGGVWSVRAAMNQGDLSSWIVAGAFVSRGDSSHAYRFGYSFSAQDYLGGNPAALAAAADGSRNVGELFALDRWAISPMVAVEYGGSLRSLRLSAAGRLFSPRVGLTIEPLKHTRVSAIVAQRMVAPGAEEFVASEAPGPWLPPERTFAPLAVPARPTPSASNGHATSTCWWSMSSTGTTPWASVGFIRTSTISWSRSLA